MAPVGAVPSGGELGGDRWSGGAFGSELGRFRGGLGGLVPGRRFLFPAWRLVGRLPLWGVLGLLPLVLQVLDLRMLDRAVLYLRVLGLRASDHSVLGLRVLRLRALGLRILPLGVGLRALFLSA